MRRLNAARPRGDHEKNVIQRNAGRRAARCHRRWPKPLDLDIETLGKEQRKGNIYKGIITRIEPSLEACFVDYGTDRHGFLPFKEVSRSYFRDYEGGRARIQDVLKEGMEVIVQVEKTNAATKARR